MLVLQMATGCGRKKPAPVWDPLSRLTAPNHTLGAASVIHLHTGLESPPACNPPCWALRSACVFVGKVQEPSSQSWMAFINLYSNFQSN